jgi:hypothetical protein
VGAKLQGQLELLDTAFDPAVQGSEGLPAEGSVGGEAVARLEGLHPEDERAFVAGLGHGRVDGEIAESPQSRRELPYAVVGVTGLELLHLRSHLEGRALGEGAPGGEGGLQALVGWIGGLEPVEHLRDARLVASSAEKSGQIEVVGVGVVIEPHGAGIHSALVHVSQVTKQAQGQAQVEEGAPIQKPLPEAQLLEARSQQRRVVVLGRKAALVGLHQRLDRGGRRLVQGLVLEPHEAVRLGPVKSPHVLDPVGERRPFEPGVTGRFEHGLARRAVRLRRRRGERSEGCACEEEVREEPHRHARAGRRLHFDDGGGTVAMAVSSNVTKA